MQTVSIAAALTISDQNLLSDVVISLQGEDSAAHARLPAKLVVTWRHQHDPVRSKSAPFPQKARATLERALPTRAPCPDAAAEPGAEGADGNNAAEDALVTAALALVRGSLHCICAVAHPR